MFLSDKQVAARYGVTRQTIWRWTRGDRTFPKPVPLSVGCTRWRLDQLQAWETSRVSGERT